MQRRNLLTGAAAVAACAAGAGVAWWRLRPLDAQSPAVQAFWASRFDGPNGEAIEMRSFLGQPLLLNFWATWCPPCVEELPLLNTFHAGQRSRSWQVLGLAVDQPAAVRQFLGRLPLVFPVGVAGFAGTDISRGLGNMSGSLPFSVVFDRRGTVVQQKIGKLSPEDLAQWAGLA